MGDVFTKAKRSEVMASVRSKGNRSTEWRLRARLVSAGVSGWRMHVVFPTQRVAIFIDGCFWHGCKKCRSIPASNREFWLNKIEGNRKRDKKVTRMLKKAGWTVLRFWEHEMKSNAQKCVDAILKACPLCCRNG